jgi:hypothetical protein
MVERGYDDSFSVLRLLIGGLTTPVVLVWGLGFLWTGAAVEGVLLVSASIVSGYYSYQRFRHLKRANEL